MRSTTKTLFVLMTCVLFINSSSIFAAATQCFNHEQDTSRYQRELNERDFDALKDYVNTKRTINVEEKARNLTFAGDVRTEWRHMVERIGSKNLRGKGAFTNQCLPISKNDFDIIFNFRVDYVCDRSWGVAHVEYDNVAGVDDNCKACQCCKRCDDGDEQCVGCSNCSSSGRDKLFCDSCDCCTGDKCRFQPKCVQDPQGYHGSGYCNMLCLRKAYFGYNLCCDGNTRFDIEIGRRNLYNVFDSQVQFLSRFDGVLLRYCSRCECIADWYFKLGGFLVDEVVNQFSWVVEAGILNIGNCGFDLKYSFIDWRRNGYNRCCVDNPRGFQFQNSQVTLYYHFDPEIICTPAFLYAAFLYNHDAKGWVVTKNKKQNIAWYAGTTVGEVIEEGDWAIDLQYQYVQAQSIPDNDVSGIGRGNVRNNSFTQSDNLGRGNTNYQGFRVEALYALTDNLTIDSRIEYSTAICDDIGGPHKFSEFKLEGIYAF